MNEKTLEKLKILADAAKYDVSCASSGTTRSQVKGGVGTGAGWGICHSFTADGRCVSLFKILLTNHCIYDCAYCGNRRSNDVRRTAFTPEELAELTIEFYKRNYIEGLFISSGVMRSPDYTMEQILRVVALLRDLYKFNGYIHAKAIPGASPELVVKLGHLVDRMSANLEIPSEQNLKLLAPEKDFQSVFLPMRTIQQGMLESLEDRKKFRNAPKFVPAGQSTQVIIGATPDTDKQILTLASALYKRESFKRMYYSAYIPVNQGDNRLPMVAKAPLVRENRLYQADWLMRFYGFNASEILDDINPDLDLDLDPKMAWALRNPSFFPIDVNIAPYEMILRVPGIGIKSAKLIVASRQYGRLNFYQLKRIGVVMKRAKYFIVCRELLTQQTVNELSPEYVRQQVVQKEKRQSSGLYQLPFDFGE